MRLVLVNGNLITGDGKTLIENSSIVIQDQYIIDVLKRKYVYDYAANKVIDVRGGYIIPGVINNHAHGVSFGPLFLHGERKLPKERVLANLNRHMMEGTTTILSCDGFATMAEVEATNKLHPINLRAATAHTPLNIEVAKQADGSGLEAVHRQTTADEMVELGAAALGEIGAGMVLGGQTTDRIIIPRAVKKRTGKDITEDQARALKEAVLGRHISKDVFDSQKTSLALEKTGLKNSLTIVDAKKLVEDAVLAFFDLGLKGLREVGEFAKRLGVPVVMHNAAPCKETIIQVAGDIGPKLIAAHCNHVSFEEEEAVDVAKQLKKHGAWVDVISALQDHNTINDMSLRFFEEGLVDLICTDFVGGYYDAILLFIERALEKGVVELPKAIAMVTSNVAKAIPRLAPKRGLIAPGMIADVATVDKNHISRVQTVIIGGRVLVEEGKLKPAALSGIL